MKTSLVLALVGFLSLTGVKKTPISHYSTPEAILGSWLTEDQEGHVEIYKKDNRYFGKITWLKVPNDENGQAFTDTENSNPSLKNRPIMGLDVVLNFEYKEGEWIGGKLYDPETGKNYKGKMWLEDDGQSLKVRGYWAVFHLTETWTKL